MKAIVHIGQPKTGTSTIQSFLQANVDRLAAQGLRYDRNVEGRGSQYEYPLAALSRIGRLPPIGPFEKKYYQVEDLTGLRAAAEMPQAALASFRARFSEGVAVFSSEHFAPWMQSIEAVQAVDAMFCDVFDDVRYIVYFRNPLTLSISRYSETLKRGQSHRLGQFLKQQLTFPSLYDVAARWCAAVGRDRLDVRLLERDWLRNGDLLEDFCASIGADFSALDVPEKANESLNQVGAECMRILNRSMPRLYADQESIQNHKRLIGLVERFSAGAPPITATPAQLELIADATRESTARLRAEFFPDRPVLFAAPSATQERLGRLDLVERVQMVLVKIIRTHYGASEKPDDGPDAAANAEKPRARHPA